MPVSEVTGADVLEILTPIWHAKPPTARIVRHRIRAVLEWAIAMEWRTDNPCDRLLPVHGSQHHVVRHRKALPHREVGAAIEKVRAANPAKVDALAFEFMVLTAARGVEVRGAVWSEIDREQRSWTVPASRMKSARAHRVGRCAAGRWRFSTRPGSWAAAGVRSCSSASAAERWAASRWAGCSGSTGSRRCRMGSGRRSGTGWSRKRTTAGR